MYCLQLNGNQIKELPNGSWCLINGLKFIASNIFDDLTNIVTLDGNVCVDKTYWEPLTIMQMKEDVKLNCTKQFETSMQSSKKNHKYKILYIK